MANKLKKIDMNSKTAKYFKHHVLEGLTKSEASRRAGISTPTNVGKIEATQTYQILERKYADVIKSKMSMDEVADEHIKNIKQDQDKGAKNNAIKMFMDKVEPADIQRHDEDKLIVILR